LETIAEGLAGHFARSLAALGQGQRYVAVLVQIMEGAEIEEDAQLGNALLVPVAVQVLEDDPGIGNPWLKLPSRLSG
jgi:hypothetical protein